MYKSLALVMMAALLAGPAAAGQKKSALDGTTWSAPISDDGKQVDTLSFNKGKFSSSECKPYGYKTGAYETQSDGAGLTWTSVQKNDAGDTMSWKGNWDGKSDQMTGSFTRTDATGKASTQEWTANKKS